MKEKIEEILQKIKEKLSNLRANREEKKEITFLQSWIRTLLIAVAISIMILLVVMVTLNNYTRHGERYTLASFVGFDVPSAQLSDSINLRFEVTDSLYVESLSPGEIIEQRPKAGSYVKSGRRVTLKINTYRPKNVVMPYVTGYSLRQALNRLTDNNIEVDKIIYQKDLATNNILKQEFNGTVVKSNSNLTVPVYSKVTLYAGLSDSNARLTVPQLTGKKYMDVLSDLHKEGFNTEIIQSESLNRGYLGQCYIEAQSPVANSKVQYGTTIKLKLINDEDEAIRSLRALEKLDKQIEKTEKELKEALVKDSINNLEQAKRDSIDMASTYDWVINMKRDSVVVADSVAVDTTDYKALSVKFQNILDSLKLEKEKF